jgi:hypothetical protein
MTWGRVRPPHPWVAEPFSGRRELIGQRSVSRIVDPAVGEATGPRLRGVLQELAEVSQRALLATPPPIYFLSLAARPNIAAPARMKGRHAVPHARTNT